MIFMTTVENLTVELVLYRGVTRPLFSTGGVVNQTTQFTEWQRSSYPVVKQVQTRLNFSSDGNILEQSPVYLVNLNI